MTDPAGDPYAERELTTEGQDPEVRYLRDLDKNQTWLAKNVKEMIPNSIPLYSKISA